MMTLLDFVTTVMNDIGMIFGESKCAYICIVCGKRKSLGRSIKTNGLNFQELKDRDQYRYLGQSGTMGL